MTHKHDFLLTEEGYECLDCGFITRRPHQHEEEEEVKARPLNAHWPGDDAHVQRCLTCAAYNKVAAPGQTFADWQQRADCPRCGNPLRLSTTCHRAGRMPHQKEVFV